MGRGANIDRVRRVVAQPEDAGGLLDGECLRLTGRTPDLQAGTAVTDAFEIEGTSRNELWRLARPGRTDVTGEIGPLHRLSTGRRGGDREYQGRQKMLHW